MVSLRFLEHLKKVDDAKNFKITVIGAEPMPAYNRVLLSSALAGEIEYEEIELKHADWYQENDITLLTGLTVISISPEAREITLSDNRVLSWNKLVLATGSNPFLLPLPGAKLPGVMTFRCLHDVESMKQTASTKNNAIVIGGGLLGLETAFGLNKLGMKVTVLHLMDRLMERQLDLEAATLLKEKIEAQGIDVLLKADTAEIIGQDAVKSVKLKSGEIIDTDIVVMAVGIKPNIILAQSAGLECKRGIVVDDQLRSSQSGIYALGECAEHNGIAYGLVEPLYEQAQILAAHLTGEQNAQYQGSSISTNLKVSGVEVFSAGEFEDADHYDRLVYRDAAQGVYKKLLIKKNEENKEFLAGAVLIGDRQDGPWYADLIRTETPIEHMRHTLIFGRDISELAA